MDQGTSPSGRAIAYAVSYSIVPQLVFWTISDLPAARFMRETLHLDAKGLPCWELCAGCRLPGSRLRLCEGPLVTRSVWKESGISCGLAFVWACWASYCSRFCHLAMGRFGLRVVGTNLQLLNRTQRRSAGIVKKVRRLHTVCGGLKLCRNRHGRGNLVSRRLGSDAHPVPACSAVDHRRAAS